MIITKIMVRQSRNPNMSHNGGDYFIYNAFKKGHGRYYFREETSGDGDVYPWPSWERISKDEYRALLADAKKKEAQDIADLREEDI